MSKHYATTVTDGDVCSFCGRLATSRSKHTGNYSCESSTNKCPAVKAKNSEGLKRAHQEGRLTADHLKGARAWSKGKNILTDKRVARKIVVDELFCENSKAPRHYIKKLIITNNLFFYKCATCNLQDNWNGQPLSLQLDHINGVNNDNRIKNLRFLCPKCHSQTSTYCGKNKNTGKKSIVDKVFIDALESCDTIHQALQKLSLPVCGHYYNRAENLQKQINARVVK